MAAMFSGEGVVVRDAIWGGVAAGWREEEASPELVLADGPALAAPDPDPDPELETDPDVSIQATPEPKSA